ncbi:chemotaxis response regulator protein-glutamate methylesterase [Leptospira ryugenii]|uniref:Protein-glutamate methylesterase/protein-glutamine glutaminase n=1 Tax=Leptospira ryugenii TaxID=1917863 RepID=A0A2P2DV94_9LEPT|nr:chemotaxis-specific protein-glutamate methyltransferase CheB [Leptospira ryugenii]GBF48513.1 chemotaxis response regulator protein-glutamate methylesterase [Leptospira ryugenii]
MKTKVLIIEDNPVVRKFYEKALVHLDFVELVGMATNGEEGLSLLHSKHPDVILCDLNMPVMDGFEFTRRAMEERPTPILIVSDLVQEENETNRYKVLDLGAIDILPKPRAGGNLEWLTSDLERKINILKRVVVFSRKPENKKVKEKNSEHTPFTSIKTNLEKYEIVAIGASTGGPQAYQTIFSQIDKNFALPIVCAQHISEGFTNSLISWLRSYTQIPIQYAKDGDGLNPGEIYFPPDGYHLFVEKKRLRLDPDKGDHRHKPSVDYLFQSIASSYKDKCIAVLLTGMGADGAIGLGQIYKEGGYTIAQDESSSIVYGMPRVAKENGSVTEVLSLDKIASRLLLLGGSRT